jgi:hypothetical protein
MYSCVPLRGPGDVPVERVGQDPLDLLVGVGVAPNQTIEGRRRVEHHRPQLAVGFPRLVGVQLDPLWFGGQAVLQTERIRQPACRVDRDHHGAAAPSGRFEAQHRRRRRLAHAAGPAAHDHR